MKGFIRSLFGTRDESTTLETLNTSRKTRSALVNEWDKLKREQRHLTNNWSIDVSSRLADIQDRLPMIEASCVASHVMARKKLMPEDALKM